MEAKLLAALIQGRSSFDRLTDLAVRDRLSDQGKRVYDAVAEYYAADTTVTHCDPSWLVDKLRVSFPAHVKFFEKLIEGLPEVSGENVRNLLVDSDRSDLKIKLAQGLARGDSLNKLAPLWERYCELEEGHLGEEEKQETVLEGKPIADIFRAISNVNRIGVAPSVVNKRLDGGVLPGHHIVVYGRPEVGKSAFVLNMAHGFLMQGKKVLYVGNEDPADTLLFRLALRSSRLSPDKLREDPSAAQEILDKNGWQNLVFVETEAGSIRDIDGWAKSISPDVIIIDQLRNLRTKQDNRVIQLEEAARGARSLGKKHHAVVVSVTQAGDSGDGKRFLGMGDLDFSNTGIPGTADLMIGIGMDDELEQLGQRGLSFPKNKISGDHKPLLVNLDGQKAYVE